ncbi:MAG: hypothetical protein AAB229_08615 [Candidatus Hydrogenedentota bacterium]
MDDDHDRITNTAGQYNDISDQVKLFTAMDLVSGYLSRRILAWPPSNLRCALGAIFARVPLFLIGGAGVGKTLLMRTIADLAGEGAAIHYDLSTCDIFHMVGLPDVSSYHSDGKTDLSFRTHSRSLLRNPGYILWDEISRSTCENQALLMEAIESSSVLGFKITSRHVLASNPTGNGFKSVHGVDAALADRALVMLNVDQGAWISNPERAGKYVVLALDGLEFGSAPTDEERAAFSFLSTSVPSAASSLLQSFLRNDDRRAGLATFTKELAMHASSLGRVISNRVLVRTARFLPYLILLNKGDTESAVRDCVISCLQHRCELQEEAVSLCARHAYEGLMMPRDPERELLTTLSRIKDSEGKMRAIVDFKPDPIFLTSQFRHALQCVRESCNDNSILLEMGVATVSRWIRGGCKNAVDIKRGLVDSLLSCRANLLQRYLEHAVPHFAPSRQHPVARAANAGASQLGDIEVELGTDDTIGVNSRFFATLEERYGSKYQERLRREERAVIG